MSAAPTFGIDVGGTKVESALVDATAEYLGLGLVRIVNAFNPHRIVLGGGVIEGHPPYVERAREVVRHRALQAAATDLDVVASTLNGQAGVIGAATMARSSRTADEAVQPAAQ